MRLPVLLNSQFCALDNYKRRRVPWLPSSFGFSCRLIAAQEYLTTEPGVLSQVKSNEVGGRRCTVPLCPHLHNTMASFHFA